MVHHAARGCFNIVLDQAHVLPFLIFCLCHGIVHSSAVKKVIWSHSSVWSLGRAVT